MESFEQLLEELGEEESEAAGGGEGGEREDQDQVGSIILSALDDSSQALLQHRERQLEERRSIIVSAPSSQLSPSYQTLLAEVSDGEDEESFEQDEGREATLPSASAGQNRINSGVLANYFKLKEDHAVALRQVDILRQQTESLERKLRSVDIKSVESLQAKLRLFEVEESPLPPTSTSPLTYLLDDELLELQSKLAQRSVQVIAELERRKAEKSLCVVCMEKRRTLAVAPCGHLCLCSECAPLFDPAVDRGLLSEAKTELIGEASQCPVCRGNVASLLKIYL